jgi:hemoglobin
MPMRLRMTSVTVVGIGFAFLAVAGCAKKEGAATDTTAASSTTMVDSSANKSLYDRLGGKAAITAVVDTFVSHVAADKRINKKFAKSNIPRVKSEIVDQVCAATGGPCNYTGRTMKDAHKNMKVTNGEFDALVEDLTTALNDYKVPDREKNELLTTLGTMRADIVEVQSNATGTALPANFKPAPPLTASSTKQE